MLVLLAVVGLSVALSRDPLRGLLPSYERADGLITLASWLAIALLAARATLAERRRVLHAALWTGAGVSVLAVLQYFGLDLTARLSAPFHYAGRAWGTMANPDLLGGYLVLLLPMSVLHSVPMYAVLVAGLAASVSRASLFAGAIAVALTTWRFPRPRTAMLAAIGVWVVLLVFTLHPASRVTSSLARDSLDSMSGRMYIAAHVWPIIVHHPWLGLGKNMLLGHIPPLRPDATHAVLIDTAHSEPLQILVESGVLGLLATVWIWLRALTTAHAAGDTALVAALLGYAVWLMFSWSQLGPANLAWVWLGFCVIGAPRTPWRFALHHLRRDVRL